MVTSGTIILNLDIDADILQGRAIAVVPRAWGGAGFVDLEVDDYATDGPLAKCQEQLLML